MARGLEENSPRNGGIKLGSFADWFTRNWIAKLVSLVLAVGLWYYSVGEENVEVTRTIPVEIKIDNEKMSVVGKPTRLVVATLQAPRSLLANLASEELRALHRIKKVETPGDYSFRLEQREIKLPSEKIRVLRIEPEVIQVKVDEIIVKKLEIEPTFLGDPAFGYRLDTASVQLDPRFVLVEGPKSQIESLGKIKTLPVDVVGRVRSFRKTVRLNEEPGLRILNESLVDIYVPIEEAFSEKAMERVPVKILGTPSSFSKVTVVPGEIKLLLKGPAKELEVLDEKNLLVYVEITSLGEGSHFLAMQVVLPSSVSLKESLPPAEVTIERKGISS